MTTAIAESVVLTGAGLRPFLTHPQSELPNYQPITAILYISRTGTVASVIQADSV